MVNLFEPNGIALCTMRGTRNKWKNHIFITSNIVGKDAVSPLDMCFVFPVTRLASSDSLLVRKGERESNLNERIIRSWITKLFGSVGPDDSTMLIVHYLYALLYSEKYQARYNQQLQSDFPRVPLTEDNELFVALAKYGRDLADCHLFKSLGQDDVADFRGTENSTIDGVFFEDSTVFIDDEHRVGFTGVSVDVWEFAIGGYQICERWLKDRRGRELSREDIEHYKKIISAVTKTIGLIKEIDQLIDNHGGWPVAFSAK